MSHHQNNIFHSAEPDGPESIGQMMTQCKNIAREIKRAHPYRQRLPAGLIQTFPAREVIDALVQLYFDTTETCYRILDYPAFMAELTVNINNMEDAKGSFLIELLLVICIAGPMHQDDAMRKELAAKVPTWLHISQTWLSAPVEKNRLTIKGIQIHLLLLLARQINRVGADIVWISAGSLIRMAMQMGLHQDPDHLGEMGQDEKEIRRQLWYTILEMNMHATLDSGMVPMITPDSYNTKPPRATDNVHGQDLTPSEIPESVAQHRPSFQHILAESLHIRVRAANIIGSLQAQPEYDQVLALGNELSKACQKAALAMKQHASLDPQNQFGQSFCNHLIRRFLLCLHFPYAVRAKGNPIYEHSYKVALDVALDVISLLDDPLYSRLLINGSGMFRDIITRGALMLYVEINSNIENDASSLLHRRHRANQELLIQDAHRVVQYAKDRMCSGETNVKGYLFLSMATAHIEAMLSGSPSEVAMRSTAKESLDTCRQILMDLAARKHSGTAPLDLEIWMHNNEPTPPETFGSDFDIFNDGGFDFNFPDLFQNWMESDFSGHQGMI